ncbi:hypothetical protein [Alysiella crassa]|uniref:DUF3828 domain-containing protein n=2 Tax=Alysiella crassa TaxID=153491 RepID=A0A376BU68_9NEIS|nr:hypothetical protein [Alysiella crassa]UOP06020.1 hypothetical protein LVJ80_09160 [Alysiella crassa]SSY80469.1 Uncharacterised protein [Alysiella crassa]
MQIFLIGEIFMKTKSFLSSMVLVAFLASPALSFAYDEQDEKTIRADVAKMKVATLKHDVKSIMPMMPQAFFDTLSKETNTPISKIKQEMLKQGEETARDAKELNASLDYVIHWKKQRVLKSKTGRDYVLLPTTTRLNGLEIKGNLIAIKENDGKWYYLQYQPIFKSVIQKAYPDLKVLPK